METQISALLGRLEQRRVELLAEQANLARGISALDDLIRAVKYSVNASDDPTARRVAEALIGPPVLVLEIKPPERPREEAVTPTPPKVVKPPRAAAAQRLTVAPLAARIIRSAFAGGQAANSLEEALHCAYGEGWGRQNISRPLGPGRIEVTRLADDICNPGGSMLKGMLRQAVRALGASRTAAPADIAPTLSNLIAAIDFSKRAEEILNALRKWGVEEVAA